MQSPRVPPGLNGSMHKTQSFQPIEINHKSMPAKIYPELQYEDVSESEDEEEMLEQQQQAHKHQMWMMMQQQQQAQMMMMQKHQEFYMGAFNSTGAHSYPANGVAANRFTNNRRSVSPEVVLPPRTKHTEDLPTPLAHLTSEADAKVVKKFCDDLSGLFAAMESLPASEIQGLMDTILKKALPGMSDLLAFSSACTTFEKMIELCSQSQCEQISEKIQAVAPRAASTFEGAALIQRLLERLPEARAAEFLVMGFRGSAVQCAISENAQSLILYSLKRFTVKDISFIIDEITPLTVPLSCHRHAGGVIQQILLRFAQDEVCEDMATNIIDNMQYLSVDRKGHYAPMYLVQHGTHEDRLRLFNVARSLISYLANSRFGSSVMESCISVVTSEPDCPLMKSEGVRMLYALIGPAHTRPAVLKDLLSKKIAFHVLKRFLKEFQVWPEEYTILREALLGSGAMGRRACRLAKSSDNDGETFGKVSSTASTACGSDASIGFESTWSERSLLSQ